MKYKLALKIIEAENGLLLSDIIELLGDMLGNSQGIGDQFFPMVIELDDMYCLGFMENDMYTEYLDNKIDFDNQIREIVDEWSPTKDHEIRAFHHPLPKELCFNFWIGL